MKNLGSISMNILRIALFLIVLGLILPLGCKSNGFQITQGILGNNDIGKGAILLSPINDFFAYLLLAVFIIAIIGIIISFINKSDNSFLIVFGCLIVSFVFMFIVLLNLKIYFNFNEFGFYAKGPVPVKIKLLVGGYVMIIGYLGGVLAFILNKLKVIK